MQLHRPRRAAASMTMRLCIASIAALTLLSLATWASSIKTLLQDDSSAYSQRRRLANAGCGVRGGAGCGKDQQRKPLAGFPPAGDTWHQLAGNDVDGRNHPDVMHGDTVHVHSDGKKVEGSLLMMQNDLDALLLETQNCTDSHVPCPIPNPERRCEWCSPGEDGQEHCLYGGFSVNGAMLGDVRQDKGTAQMFRVLQSKVSGKDVPEQRVQAFKAVVFECDFSSAKVHGTGRLSVPWVRANQATQMRVSESISVPLPAPKRDASEIAICGRALFNHVSAESVAKHVEYYAHHGMGPVIMYDVGLAFYKDKELLDQYIANGSLRLINLNNVLNQRYGPIWQVALLNSFAVAQHMLKYDCQIRARLLGFEHALHIDIDEYVFPGKENLDSEKPLPELLLHELQDSAWMTIGALINPNDDTICGATPQLHDSPSAYRWDWGAATEMSNTLHRAELKLPEKYFENRYGGCTDYKYCLEWRGSRKLLVSTKLPPLHLFIHRVIGDTVVPLGFDLSVERLYIRHHRCANFQIEASRDEYAATDISLNQNGVSLEDVFAGKTRRLNGFSRYNEEYNDGDERGGFRRLDGMHHEYPYHYSRVYSRSRY